MNTSRQILLVSSVLVIQGCHAVDIMRFSNGMMSAKLLQSNSNFLADSNRSYVVQFDTTVTHAKTRIEAVPNIGNDQGFHFRLAADDSVTIYHIRVADSVTFEPFRMFLKKGGYWFQPVRIYSQGGIY